jgi:formamidopyrimidine-DNA glycosylase
MKIMPELPEVQTIVSELNRKLKKRTIKSVTVNAPKMISMGPHTVSNIRVADNGKVALFKKMLVGRRITAVKRRAKLIIINLSRPSDALGTPSPFLGEGNKVRASLSLLVHLKMTGQFIFEDDRLREKTGGKYRMFNNLTAPPVKLPGKHTHVIFEFTDGSHLYFNDIRKFGYMKLVRDDEIDQVKELLEYGPEPLDNEFTIGAFEAAASKAPMGKIKQVLMNPKVVAGIGNIYSDEILFHAGVRPTRRVSSLSDKELSAVYKWIKSVLTKAIKAKGSSVGDFVRTDGSWGQMGKYHFVYGRKGQKCKKCGTIIQSVKLNGRTGSFCPNCQK